LRTADSQSGVRGLDVKVEWGPWRSGTDSPEPHAHESGSAAGAGERLSGSTPWSPVLSATAFEPRENVLDLVARRLATEVDPRDP
jgi:hypothetical protein